MGANPTRFSETEKGSSLYAERIAGFIYHENVLRFNQWLSHMSFFIKHKFIAKVRIKFKKNKIFIQIKNFFSATCLQKDGFISKFRLKSAEKDDGSLDLSNYCLIFAVDMCR